MIVAIDGPAASGKGTLGRRLAEGLGLPHLDTGLLYRAAGLRVLRAGGDPADPAAAAEAARAVTAADLEDPELRGDEAAQSASVVSAVPAVRAALLDMQRAFGRTAPGAVLDGRDIGTVVFPDAEVKIFVTADVEVRARRRFEELRARGRPVIYEQVLADLRDRDERDRRRPVSPLVAADDAFVLDTSGLDADAAYARALDHVAFRTGRSLDAAGP